MISSIIAYNAIASNNDYVCSMFFILRKFFESNAPLILEGFQSLSKRMLPTAKIEASIRLFDICNSGNIFYMTECISFLILLSP